MTRNNLLGNSATTRSLLPGPMPRSNVPKPNPQVGTLRNHAETVPLLGPPHEQKAIRDDQGELIRQLEIHQVEVELQNEELRSAQHELELSQAKYRDLFELAPVGYLSLADNTQILEANLAAVTLLGLDRGEISRTKLSAHIAVDPANVFERHRRAVLGSEQVQSCEVVLVGTDQQRRELRIQSRRTCEPQPHWRMALTDVTELHGLQNALNQARKLESLGTMAGRICHDFGNVLCGILGGTEVALQRLNRPGMDTRELLEQVRDSALRGRTMVRQLQLFARSNEFDAEIVDVDSTVRAMEAALGHRIEDGVRVSLQLGSHGCVRINAIRLEQILLNLAANAAHAMPAGGTFRIETKSLPCNANTEIGLLDTAHVLLTASDNGPGMDPDMEARAFEPFSTNKPAWLGMGLGLYGVRTTIREAGGEVRLSSRPDQGTAVRIYLPQVDALLEGATLSH